MASQSREPSQRHVSDRVSRSAYSNGAMASSSARQRDGIRPRAAGDIFAAALLLMAAAAVLTYVVDRVAVRTIDIVHARRLLPTWDLASHLCQGWVDYHLLATGHIARLAWDVWLQGYWPPASSLYQVPFYLVLGGGLTSGLWSGLIAFVLIGVTGCALLWQQRGRAALVPASLFVALLISSPFLLAYASVAMIETLAALAQLLVLFFYAAYRQTPDRRTAHLFAISLSLLFFTKYNYFFLLAAPLALHEWLERTSGWTAMQRVDGVSRFGRRVISSPAGVLILVYAGALLLILVTGGFEVHLLGQRISVRGIGNPGLLAVYFLLGYLLYCHRRGRIDWSRISEADARVRPLLLWLVLPVTVWLASPYPNHLRDFISLLLNIEMGEPALGPGVAMYIDTLRTTYFYGQWVLVFLVVAFAAAAVRYRKQTALMQVLVLAIAMQSAAIALHHTRFPRFLLPTVVLLCLAASNEVGGWFEGPLPLRRTAVLFAPLPIVAGLFAARAVVDEPRFRAVAFESYTDSDSLRTALDAIRGELHAGDRLVTIGQSNRLSPALLKWELGPPSGVPCFPYEAGGARRLDLALATRVLLLVPIRDDENTTLEMTSSYLVRRSEFLDRVGDGEFVLRRESLLSDLGVRMQLYDRRSRPERLAACN